MRKFNFEGGLIYYVSYDVNDVGLIPHYRLQHQHWIGESKPEEESEWRARGLLSYRLDPSYLVSRCSSLSLQCAYHTSSFTLLPGRRMKYYRVQPYSLSADDILHLTSFSVSHYFGNVKDNFIDSVNSKFLPLSVISTADSPMWGPKTLHFSRHEDYWYYYQVNSPSQE